MRAQRGVAAVTALLIVAVAASTATYMLAQQSAMLNQASLVASRAQAELYARAGLDWARGVIAQDAKSAGSVDSLDEGWAQPIAGLPVERALVAGQLGDEQAKYNLNNLVRGSARSEPDVLILRRLLTSLEIPPDLADAVIDWIDLDSDLSGIAGAEDGHYLALARPHRAANQPLAQVEELHRIRGFTPERVAKLRPHVTALPSGTPVNANTAAAEVLAAILPELSPAQINTLVESRRAKPMRSKAEIGERVKNLPPSALATDLDVKSAHFRVRIQVAQDDVQLASEALIRREQNAATVVVWRRPLY